MLSKTANPDGKDVATPLDSITTQQNFFPSLIGEILRTAGSHFDHW
jgi:hypothetical protein